MSKPLPDEVAKRLLILKYQVVQALAMPPQDLLKNVFPQWSKQEQKKFTNNFAEHSSQLVTAMKSAHLWDLITKEEKEFIQSVPPKVKPQQHLNAMWRLESVVILMWVLGMVEEFPPFDSQTNPEIMKQIPYEDPGLFISRAKLGSDADIERKRALAELWHWRSRTRQLIEMGKQPPSNTGFTSFDQIVQAVATEALKQGDLSQVIDNDFVAKGKPYRILTTQEWSEVRSITMERHHALNWLCGYAPGNKWDKTPTET